MKQKPQKLSEETTKMFKEIFNNISKLEETGKFKCWDCGKEIENVNFDEETKKECPLDMNGFRLIICIDCKGNEDY